MKTQPQIFISYAQEDLSQVQTLGKKLQKAKFKPWVAERQLLPGEKWSARIKTELKRSDFFLFCISSKSAQKRGMIQDEIKMAQELARQRLPSDIYFIPVRFEDCDVPDDLMDLQWVDFFERDGWSRLKKAIQTQWQQMQLDKRPTSKKRVRATTHKHIKPSTPTSKGRVSSVRTSKIVGRETELRAIRRAIAGNKKQRVLMFVGFGGIGKTRLLEEVGSIIKESKDKRICWSGLIDVYHPEAHSDLGIRDQIIAGVDPSNQYFRKYRARVKKYREHLTQGLGGKSLETERAELEQIFLENYQELAKKFRVVLAFDTLELIEYESEIVQDICAIKTETTTLKNWLLTQIPQLPNTVTLLAGRQQKQGLSSDTPSVLQDTKIWADLEAHFVQAGIFQPEDKYVLNEFTEKEAEQYYEDLVQRNPRLYDEIPEPALKEIWTRTERRPIRISLAIDLALHGSPGAVAPLYDSDPGVKPNIDEQLIEMLLGLDDPGRDVLLYLAAARKGINADLMYFLDPSVSKVKWAQRIEELQEFAFIKSRPGTDSIFLHDELYALFECKSELSKRETARRYYDQIAEYYRGRLKTLNKDLQHRREKGLETEAQILERQEVMLALLHYELQIDPKEGFERVFARWDDEAIEGHEKDLDNRLRDELWRFLASPVTQLAQVKARINLDEINRDSAVRWVRRYLAREDPEQACQVAEKIIASPDPLFQVDDRLFKADLDCAYGEALVYLDAPREQVERVLNQSITSLTTGNGTTDRDLWRKNRILGRAHNNLGFVWQKAGRSEQTERSYRHALRYQKDNLIERANTLNNLAYALANLGRIEVAQLHIEEAIKIRRQLGLQYLLALSMNVQGYIHVLGDHPLWGIKASEEALRIFRNLADPRGIGLALNALGFAYRKRGDLWKMEIYPAEEAIYYFTEAEEHLQGAQAIFPKQVKEPFEEWRTWNELGSTYCDWAFLIQETQGKDQALAKWNSSVECQEKALAVAKANALILKQVDSLDDLAQVCHDKGDSRQAAQYLGQIEHIILPEYRLVKEKGFTPIADPDEGYWLALGKLHLQYGIWAFHDLHAGTTEMVKEQAIDNAITNYGLAFAYFAHYYPGSYNLSLTTRSFAKRLEGIEEERADQVRAIIAQVARDYQVDLSTMLETVDNTLGT